MAPSAEGLEVVNRERGSRCDRNIETRATVDGCVLYASPVLFVVSAFWNINERGTLNFVGKLTAYGLSTKNRIFVPIRYGERFPLN